MLGWKFNPPFKYAMVGKPSNLPILTSVNLSAEVLPDTAEIFLQLYMVNMTNWWTCLHSWLLKVRVYSNTSINISTTYSGFNLCAKRGTNV